MKKLISKFKWSVLGIFLPMLALAQEIPTVKQTTRPLEDVIKGALGVVIGIVGLIAVVVIVYGGILITVSGGDEEKSKAGKNYLLYGIIGLVVVILSYSIISYIVTSVR